MSGNVFVGCIVWVYNIVEVGEICDFFEWFFIYGDWCIIVDVNVYGLCFDWVDVYVSFFCKVK